MLDKTGTIASRGAVVEDRYRTKQVHKRDKWGQLQNKSASSAREAGPRPSVAANNNSSGQVNNKSSFSTMGA